MIVLDKALFKKLSIDILIIYCILFPGDKLNIKEVFLVIALVNGFPDMYYEFRHANGFVGFWGVIYPVVMIIASVIIGESTFRAAIPFGYMWLFVLLMPSIVKENIDIRKPFVFATTVVASIINFIFLLDLLGVIPMFSNPILVFFSEMNELRFGKGITGTFGYSLFYKSCPLILVTYAYILKKKKYFYAIFLFLSLMACGTRANFLVGIAITIGVIIFNTKEIGKKVTVVIVIACASIAFIPELFGFINQLNELRVNSDNVRTETMIDILAILRESPRNLLFGTGLGSMFYSSSRKMFTDVVEVSFFDYLRQVGIVGFILLIVFIVRPIKWYMSNDKCFLIAYLGYISVAAIDPLLVTSTSFMLYILAYTNGYSDKRIGIYNQ